MSFTIEDFVRLANAVNNGSTPDSNGHLKTEQIHLGAKNYELFCKYAGIVDVYDSSKSTLTYYDTPFVKGIVRWSHSLYGEILGVTSYGADSLHQRLLSRELKLPDKYYTPYCGSATVLTKYAFADWINDQILERDKLNGR